MLFSKRRWRSMAQRLVLVLPLVAIPFSSAWSLGLDEIEVESALNERFSATIELLDARDMTKDEIVVSMASREDFDRIGVERFFYLTDLQFDVDLSGTPKVVVSSGQPISEPYLNFIVEVLWPKGRLLKEYTVLLDPPTFSSAAAPAVQSPASEPVQSQPSRSAQQSSASQQGTRVRLSEPSTSSTRSTASAADSGDGVLTTRDDTLWKIASRTLPSDRVTVNQQMLAIQELNPQAFIRNNINLLKAGYQLQIPTEQEALAMSQEEASLAVRDQTNTWREPTEQVAQTSGNTDSNPQLASQVDATTAPAAAQESAASNQGQVRIVADASGLSQGLSDSGAEEANQLLETNETLTRQVDELNYQLDRQQELTANQIQLKDRQLEVKDQELAQLQERFAAMEAQIEELKNQTQETRTPPPAEVPWWQSPLLLGGIIGLLVLLLVFMLIAMRRNKEEVRYEDPEPDYEPYVDPEPVVAAAEEDPEEVAEEAVALASESEDDDLVLDIDDDLETDAEDLVSEDVSSLEDVDGLEQGDQDADLEGVTGDVIGEADIYIAYGRYGQAVSLLQGALNNDPDAHEVRLKLLEVCVEAEDPNTFAEHAQYLVANCDDEEVLMACRDLEARLNENVEVLDDAPAAGADTTAEADSAEATDGDLDIEPIDIDLESSAGDELSLEEDSSNSSSDDDLGELEDFELEFDTEDAAVESVTADEGEAGDLGGDLGIDFDPEGEAESESAAADAATESAGEVSADADNADDDFDFDEGDADINATKLDLAEAYIDMGDGDGARDILAEVIADGSDEQKSRAQEMLDGIES